MSKTELQSLGELLTSTHTFDLAMTILSAYEFELEYYLITKTTDAHLHHSFKKENFEGSFKFLKKIIEISDCDFYNYAVFMSKSKIIKKVLDNTIIIKISYYSLENKWKFHLLKLNIYFFKIKFKKPL